MSRELYDLCRRYKHYYMKHNDVLEWDKKYHDLDLRTAINTTTAQLREATHELQNGLFREFNVHCMNIDTQHEMMYPMDRFGISTYHNSISDVEFHESKEFLYCLVNYMQEIRNEM